MTQEASTYYMAMHLKNEKQKQKLLAGEKGRYIIKDLDLREFHNYNFNPENIYIFEKCILWNVILNFQNEYIYFVDCVLRGNVAINNSDVIAPGTIVFRQNQVDKLNNLQLYSSQVAFKDNNIHCDECISISCNKTTLVSNTIKAPTVNVDFKQKVKIKECVIDTLDIKDNGIIHISDSCINGEYIKERLDSQEIKGNSRVKK